ncbi:DNA ligase 1 [Drosophila ficusphila]|uniref:DNA ligase 1 n=1 Tax=Drosophila ficusphila TaxID=30025 RepID=UPI0007E63926|nr:DNA ligase 1 [Drosophila ficusphila]
MCLLATSAAGESMIEVDENGDEYELKRFYIQGRQLSGDGSQSQCVVTRRKRSGRSAGATVSVSSQPLKVESLPAKEHREGGAVLQEVESSNRRYVALQNVHLQNDDDDQDDDDDDDAEVEEQQHGLAEQSSKSPSNYVPAALALPLQGQATTAAHLNQGVSVVANAASHANVAEDAGIVVVQSHQPPKVNPDTHAVFELKPVHQSNVDQSGGVGFYPFVHPWEVVEQPEDDYDEDDYDEEEDYDDFYYGNGFYGDQPGFHGLGVFEEEIISEDQPVSTVASWVTGEDEDDHSDHRPVFNKRPKKNRKNQKNRNQIQKNQNQKNKRQQQKKRKQQAQESQGLSTKRKQEQKKKQQKQDKDQKKKQDKDQKKKKPEENQNQQEMEEITPVDVIKKPVAMDSTEDASASSSASSNNSASSSNSSDSTSTSQKNKKKKKKPSSSSGSSSSSLSQRRTKKKKKQSSSSSSSISSSNKRRRPSSSNSSGSSSSSSSIGGYRRRRPQQQQQLQQQRRRKTQQQKRRRQQQQQQMKRRRQQQRRRLRNKNRQFYGDEPIINCIYINKDPPTTTTPRPFWNILGRQSDANPSSESPVASSEESQVDPVAREAVLQAVRRNFGEFGGRKRTNLRFVS